MKEKLNKGEIVNCILAIISVGGILLAGAVAPGIFKMIPRSFFKRCSKKSVNQTLERLKRRGFIKTVSGPNGWRVELTEKGRTELFAFETRNKLLKKPRRWNGKWHLMIFDIREEQKSIREMVRLTLSRLGFYRLQDSVWVYPYECEDVLELLRTKYKVRYDALYIRAEKIANDRWLRQHFGLSKKED